MELLQEVGMALQQQIDAGLSQRQIGKLAADIFSERCCEIDDTLRSILRILYKMEQEQGPEFNYTLDELSCLAQAMIHNDKDPKQKMFNLVSERHELVLEKEDLETRKILGNFLKKMLDVNYSIDEIAHWAWKLDWNDSWASGTSEILTELYLMEGGPEFELTKQELYYLANLMIDYEENPCEKLRQNVRER